MISLFKISFFILIGGIITLAVSLYVESKAISQTKHATDISPYDASSLMQK